jgi:hypothetical protein
MSAQSKTREEIDQMTLWDLVDLNHYWKVFPPVAETVLQALGGEPKMPEESSKKPTEADLRAGLAMMNGG